MSDLEQSAQDTDSLDRRRDVKNPSDAKALLPIRQSVSSTALGHRIVNPAAGVPLASAEASAGSPQSNPEIETPQASASSGLSPSPASADRVVASPGRPLEPHVRASMEQSYGRHLGDVRLHTDESAAESAAGLGALAYTFGRHVVFGQGRYSPTTSVGRRLLAHELAHVVQQEEGGSPPALDARAPHEHAAGAAAEAVAAGQRGVSVRVPTGVGLARSNGGGAKPTSTAPLTQQDLFKIIQTHRAWEFNPGGAPIQDPAGVGRGVGPAAGGRRAGSAVFTVIQVVDRDGKQVELQYGEHLHYGDPHAEQAAMQSLERNLAGRDLHGGRMNVMVDQTPCAPGQANCMGDLADFARQRGLGLDVDVPTRPPQRGAGPDVAPRTAARGSQRTDMPEVAFNRIIETPPPAAGPTGGGRPPAVPPERPLERLPEGKVERSPGGAPGEGPQTRFTTEGRTIYNDPSDVRPSSEIYDPNARPPPPIGAGLFEAGAIWIPAAIDVLQDIGLKNNVAHQMLGHWGELETWRKADSNVWIVCTVTLSEWDFPNEAGNVLRQVVEVAFYRGATRAEAYAASRGPSYSRVAPRGSHLVGPFTAEIPPTADLAELKAGVEKEKTCFIATACYGSPMAPEVGLLREFRDLALIRSAEGRAFVRGYYRVSPAIAMFLRRHQRARFFVRFCILAPLVAGVKITRHRWAGSLAALRPATAARAATTELSSTP